MSLPEPKPPIGVVYAAIITSMLFWGGSNVVGKHTVDNFPLFATLFLRFCIATLALWLFFLLDRQRQKLSWRDVGRLSLLGTLGTTLSVGLLFFGMSRASVLDASIILALAPLFLAVAGWVWLKERYCRHTLAGFGLAVAGAIIALALFRPMEELSLVGDLAVLASVLSLSAYTLWSKDIIRDYSPTIIAAFSFLVATISFAPLAAWEYWSHPEAVQFDAGIISGLLYMGIAASVIAYIMYEWSLSWLPATHVAALSYLQPVSSIWLGLIFLHEPAYWSYAIGGILVAAGVILSLTKPHEHVPVAAEIAQVRPLSRRN